jgi:hypothetical protein
MSAATNLAVLRERLGEDGTECLLSILESTRREVKDEVMTSCSERFERRLAEESSETRLEMTRGFARVETTVIKWCFAFWIGQAAVLTGIELTYLKLAAG